MLDLNTITFDLECSKNLVSEDFMAEVENVLHFKIGEQLRKYLLDYGYIAFGNTELSGINSLQGMDSDMIKDTLKLREISNLTDQYVVIENIDSHSLVLCDKEDKMHSAVSGDLANYKITPLNKTLFEFIMSRYHKEKY